jgi:excisionase family DNA binding protein
VTNARFSDVPDVARSWLTVAEAAAYTGRSARTVQEWIHDGRLRTIDLAGLRLVPKSDALDVERETRRAMRRGRPGARHAGSRAEVAS